MIVCFAWFGCPQEPAAPPIVTPPPARVVDVPEVLQAEACPPGVVASAGWPGEYPGPVVDITADLDLPARVGPCDAEPRIVCRVAAGLVHPWAAANRADYQTVRTVERFEVSRQLRLGTLELSAGDVVEMTQNIGEGFCAYRMASTSTEAECPKRVGDALVALTPRVQPVRQMVRVACRDEGGQAHRHGWIVVDDGLLATDGVQKGAVLEYGKVGTQDQADARNAGSRR